ncbi:MAG: DUF349 domain-containing protein [Nitrococcus sp.]|nr:DUF349 domain-containing protein [Nitrococcus sp.]
MWFDRFRRPRWQHRNPKIRQEAAASLSAADSGEYATLTSLAVDDPSPVVRATAVKRLFELETLRQRAQEDTDATVREVARTRYCRLLAEGCETLDYPARMAALSACEEVSVLAWVARLGREEDLRVAALERLDDPLVLEEIVNGDAGARVRRVAIERVRDEAVLERLERHLRRTNRKLARLARERRDELHRRHTRLEAVARERLAVVAALEALAEHPWSTAMAAERQRLLNRWEAQGKAPSPDLQQRLAAALYALDHILPSAPTHELQADPPAPAIFVQVEHAVSPEVVLDEIDEIILSRGPSPEAIAEVQRLLARPSEQSAVEPARGPAKARAWLDAAQRYLLARPALEAALACGEGANHDAVRALEQRIAWPSDFPSPALVREGRRLIAVHGKSGQDRRQQERNASLERLQHQLDEIEGALGEGYLRLARRLLQRAEQLAQGIGGSMPSPLDRRLRHAMSRVAELRDWRRFAVLPKQEVLCDAMEALAEAKELTPPERARRVRDLQSQWKATGGSDSTQSRALWARFSRAADRAFASCRGWFEAEAQRRRINLTERERICAQLAEFIERAEWELIAVSALEQIRYTAREEWRHFGPVDREQLGALRQRFEAFMATLTRHIEAKRAAHRARKAELVDQARVLLDHDDPAAAAEQAKQLQQQWKALGSASPSADRALWKAFRGACDGIFANRDAQRARRRSRWDQLLQEAEEICVQFEALVGESGPTDGEALRKDAARLRSAFRSLSLPHGRDGRTMNERFEAVSGALSERLQQLEAAAARRELAELKRLAELSRAWEAGAAGPISLAEVMELPGWLLEPLRQRWAAAEAGKPKGADPEASRRICVRLEILAGIESPPADEALRLELQVKRLSEGMGSGGQPLPRREAQLLAAQWYGLPGAEALQERVDAALERLF